MTAGSAAALNRCTAGSSRDSEESTALDMSTLHERLVAYVHTLTHGSRRGVWSEHSYARERAGGGAGAAGDADRVRELLAPRAAPPRAPLDVERCESPPPSPPAAPAPAPRAPSDDDDTDCEEAEWETRAAAAAPSAAHARLLAAAAAALRDMRLARLATSVSTTSARRDQVVVCARRLRRALAPVWHTGAPAWLHHTLAQHLPRAERRLYDEALCELHRALPRLAPSLSACPPRPAPPHHRHTEGVGTGGAVGAESSPWLVWVASGVAALDARWEARLAALVHTRVLRGAGGAGQDAAPPEPWCAAAAAAVRAGLTDALAEAGSRTVILGGAGAGGAVALVLARGAGGAGRAEGGVRGCALVAPPLCTAEGARHAADDALQHVRLPLLLVCGSRAAQCARLPALAVTEAARNRRLLLVRGADCELRLSPRARARHRLPQHALDAALAEEVVRWAVETAEQEEAPPSPPAPAPAAERRRPVLPTIVREIDLTEEYAHLPLATPPAAPAPAPTAPPPTPNSRVVADSERRFVSRGSGGTPLALLPPRRSAAPSAPAAPGVAGGGALGAADIMQLPIVFADDVTAPPGASAAGASAPALTVTSGHPAKRGASGEGGAEGGSVKFTRVILAKRGARHPARRLLLRRAQRLVPTTQA